MPSKVLVVDDNKLTRSQLKDILVADGMEVAGEATDGREAVHMASSSSPTSSSWT